MFTIAPTTGVPIKIWLDSPASVEPQALKQLQNTASLRCMFKHVAVMPDVHFGIGASVGSVVATKRAIIPACVGVDIGCGMIASSTPYTLSDLPDNLSALRSEIEAHIPVGFSEHKAPLKEAEQWFAGHPSVGFTRLNLRTSVHKPLCQIGTLGGGNHFVELCTDVNHRIWIMLHSGSRNIGNLVARMHIERAKDVMRQYFIDLPDPDLSYFVEHTAEFASYWHDLQWCQAYALENRRVMLEIVRRILGRNLKDNGLHPHVPFTVNCHHNYAELEHHFGENVYVTRKGAVRARTGDYAIIPGSMGTKSYIVKGKGNEASFDSCSHGAGRRMSRAKARQSFTLEDVSRQTEGVECKKDMSVLDELPGAYKPIEEVMKQQEDLVEIVCELKQFLCVKG